MLRIRLKKSPIGYAKDQGRTVRALGLTKLNAEVVQADTPVIRGMLRKVGHLVEVEELADAKESS
ncbi:MAG: 50S ribosomal protein L30 [Armatimonadota bacterium]|jgi:large subunit ribosomal protein L30|nr:MAG: 50S ribosomal protein L30 [Armatimonadota bacterium]